MTPALDHDQGKTLAASGDSLCGMGTPAPIAGRHKSQELRGGRHSHRRRAGGFCLPATRSVATSLRVGWMYRSADEFLTFIALTRAGIRPDHAVALLSFNPGHHVLQDLADVPECHSSTSSLGHEHDPSERPNGTILYQRGNLPDHQGARQHE